MGLLKTIITTPLGLYAHLLATVVIVNAVGARADARVWAAMRRVERAKQAAKAAEAARQAAAPRAANTNAKLPPATAASKSLPEASKSRAPPGHSSG